VPRKQLHNRYGCRSRHVLVAPPAAFVQKPIIPVHFAGVAVSGGRRQVASCLRPPCVRLRAEPCNARNSVMLCHLVPSWVNVLVADLWLFPASANHAYLPRLAFGNRNLFSPHFCFAENRFRYAYCRPPILVWQQPTELSQISDIRNSLSGSLYEVYQRRSCDLVIVAKCGHWQLNIGRRC
jgi:hypothetical protein